MRKPRHGQHVIEVDFAECGLGACLPDRGAEGADHSIDSPPRRTGRQLIEVDKWIGQLGMRQQRASRRRDKTCDTVVTARLLKCLAADQACGACKQKGGHRFFSN